MFEIIHKYPDHELSGSMYRQYHPTVCGLTEKERSSLSIYVRWDYVNCPACLAFKGIRPVGHKNAIKIMR